jgi:catechol 2,3-dioxygenase-like lactoylglutathione lyase family enzyme
MTEGLKMNGMCDHIGLFSQNPEILVPFYTDKLGFDNLGSKTISKEWMTQIFGIPSVCQLIKLKLGSAVVEIFVLESGGPDEKIMPSLGYNHWGMGVEDKESFVQGLESRGVSVLRLEATGRFIYFIKDPEGNLIEISESRARS